MDYAFVGGGNMGHALAAALIRHGVARPSQVLVVDPSAEARRRAEALGCRTGEQVDAQLAGFRVLVLAVKPQSAAEALAPLKGRLEPRQVVVSIMAGVRIETIQAALGHSAVVRVMPKAMLYGRLATRWAGEPRASRTAGWSRCLPASTSISSRCRLA